MCDIKTLLLLKQKLNSKTASIIDRYYDHVIK